MQALIECEVCGYKGTRKHIHTQADGSEKGFRWICCKCLGHEYGSCWKNDIKGEM